MRQITYCQRVDNELEVRFFPIREEEKREYKIMEQREVDEAEWEALAEWNLKEVRNKVAEALGLVSNLWCA